MCYGNNSFAACTQILLPKHMFPSLDTMRKERNRKDKEIKLLIALCEDRAFLWNEAHEDYKNRDSKEVA